jgi:hypothetical protein
MIPDAEQRLLERLIHECTVSGRVYLAFCVLLIIGAVVGFLFPDSQQQTISLGKGIGGVIGVGGTVPGALYRSAVNQKIALEFLKDKWQEAAVTKDPALIKEIKPRIDKLIDGINAKKGTTLSL